MVRRPFEGGMRKTTLMFGAETELATTEADCRLCLPSGEPAAKMPSLFWWESILPVSLQAGRHYH